MTSYLGWCHMVSCYRYAVYFIGGLADPSDYPEADEPRRVWPRSSATAAGHTSCHIAPLEGERARGGGLEAA